MESEIPAPQERYWHRLFRFGVAVKGVNGIWESIMGTMLLFSSSAGRMDAVRFFARRELIEDPHDKVIVLLMQALQRISAQTVTFAAVYILAHGLLNLFLAIQLYRDKHWAYLVTIGSMILFMTYQVYRISLYHSVALTLLTLLDAAFVIIAWHEYKHHRETRAIL